MFDEGVDVLLHTADSTGRGAIRAAERRDRTVIGFMNRDDPSHACVKALISTDVEIVVTSLLQDIVAGRFRSGVIACGLASDRQRFDMFEGVGAATKGRVDELAGLIAGGRLSVRAAEIAP
jgi:basic membrane lipoprotein Med (substrate-binding protein (PBP1-ABC) superfamily)